jgi:nucleoside-diphosphate-sugar epimerase
MTTFLLTGATGVVGSEVTDKILRLGHNVYALTRNPPRESHPRLRYIIGDITRRDLGLGTSDIEDVRANVEAVIHAAGEVSFTQTGEVYMSTNAGGTANCVELALSIGARFMYVSSAYAVRAEKPGFWDKGYGPSSYTASKYASECIVRESIPSAVIVRPSIVVGRSRDGYIRTRQGLHYFMRNLARGRFSFLPGEASWKLDTIPADHLASFIVAASDVRYSGRTLWATVGEAALSVADIAQIALGPGSPMPRFVHPEVFDRLIRPAFLPELPVEVARYIESLVEISDQLFSATDFSSDLRAVTGIVWSSTESHEIIRKTAATLRDPVSVDSSVMATV